MSAGLWIFTDHCCRRCYGRVMLRVDATPYPFIHRCAICGLEASGPVEAICACGLKLRNGGDGRFRCRPAPPGTPDGFPEVVIAQFADDGLDRILNPQIALPISTPSRRAAASRS